MAQNRRLLLGQVFKNTLGIKNVYFQPPKTVMLQYPCIIYKLDNMEVLNADDRVYFRQNRYLLTYVTKDPDDDMIFRLVDELGASWANAFTKDNLNHYNYNLYF